MKKFILITAILFGFGVSADDDTEMVWETETVIAHYNQCEKFQYEMAELHGINESDVEEMVVALCACAVNAVTENYDWDQFLYHSNEANAGVIGYITRKHCKDEVETFEEFLDRGLGI